MVVLTVKPFSSIFLRTTRSQFNVQRICRVKILFTSTQHTSFISQDLELLRKHHAVHHVITRGIFAPFAILRHILGANVTFTWFASTYSFVVVLLARLMNKPSVLVIGGVDVARIPEMRYGIWLSLWKSLLVRHALRNASKVVAVDESLKAKAIALANYGGSNILCVPTGYDSARWHPEGTKEPVVLTVAKCDNEWKMKVKGIDVLFECARALPDIRFAVVGFAPQLVNRSRERVPANVDMMGVMDQSELLQWYQRAKVYCQPSYSEGFPNSVCEAMLCGCIPVGTNIGGIPRAINGCGFLVPYGNVRQLADAIQKALMSPASVGERARAYVAEHFTLEKREALLLHILEESQN